MRASVIIRSKDEADRLRLTLASLANQTEAPEVIVIDDGSSDHTREVVAEAARGMELIAIHHAESKGRSEASNAGAAKASGDIVIFLDGDTLAEPGFVARHLDVHRQGSGRIVRGENWHLRGPRLFLDPETGTPKPGEEARVAAMPENEKARSRVTRQQIRNDFSAIDRRAQPGIYPGFGPRRLMEIEMDALKNHPDCPVLWAAASGSNQSLSRDAFLKIGGFHPELTINEHREIALRLCRAGLRMALCAARSYHLIHRSGWRDPLHDTTWEQIFYAAHPIPEVALLSVLWASLGDPAPFPAEARIDSLPELAEVAERYRNLHGLDAVREAHLQAKIS